MNSLSTNSVTFTLKTINADFTINDYSFSWHDVDFKKLLGEMYYKYNKFKICCNYISSGYQAISMTNLNILILCSMSGLDFSNYDVNTSGTVNTFDFGIIQVNASIGLGIQLLNGLQGQVFTKEETVTDLKVYYKRITDDAIDTTVNYPPMIFNFSIYPVE